MKRAVINPAYLMSWVVRLKRYALICRLHRPADIALLLLPAGWATMLAGGDAPHFGAMATLMLAAVLMRCAAWVFDDWMEDRLLKESPDSYFREGLFKLHELQWLLGGLLLATLLLVLPLPETLFYYTWPAPLLLLGYPYLKTRLLLTQPYLGLCYASLVPMAYAVQGVHPDKSGWLLFIATWLWASGFSLLYAMPRRNHELRIGIRSLAQLFGANSWMFVMAMQLSMVFTLWLVGRQLELGIFFSLGLIVVLLLVPYQLWLLFSHPLHGPVRSYYNQIWSGIAIQCGLIFPSLCAC